METSLMIVKKEQSSKSKKTNYAATNPKTTLCVVSVHNYTTKKTINSYYLVSKMKRNAITE
ncbi:MAG: hypothetical protein BGO34_09365 [Bacteroidia bacterium 44-10]|nr:MAG: hypothetical protein BGO34_09365 [Bacteroidia bacterium 44-10]